MTIPWNDVRILGGGTSLGPWLFRDAPPDVTVVSLSDRPELGELAVGETGAAVGAMVRIAALARLSDATPAGSLLSAAVRDFGTPHVRRQATVGGNLASTPPGDLAPLFLALDARVQIEGPQGAQELPVETYLATWLGHPHLLRGVAFDTPAGLRGRYVKVGWRAAMAVAALVLAVVLRVDRGTCVAARLALGGFGLRPARLRDAEQALTGQPLSRAAIETASRLAAGSPAVQGDALFSAAYRRRVLRHVVADALAALA